MRRLILVMMLGACGSEPDEPGATVEPCTPTVWYVDQDGDGAGSAYNPISACEAPEGMVGNADDCDDGDPAAMPGARWFLDEDGDGFGGEVQVEACARPDGHVAEGGDCDDRDPARNPDDGLFTDEDGDGFGDPSGWVPSCGAQPGVANDLDCDDDDAAVNPTAREVCDEVDNDCDGATDDQDEDLDIATTRALYVDEDGDGWGVGATVGRACAPGEGEALQRGDCDDADPDRYPSQLDWTDEVDQNCDGLPEHGFGEWAQGWRSALITNRGDTYATGFGGSSASLDLDGDGRVELLVGEPHAIVGTRRSVLDNGRVSLLPGLEPEGGVPRFAADYATGRWRGKRDPEEEQASRAGASVALHPDLDGDGAPDAIIQDPLGGGGSGRVFSLAVDPVAGSLGAVETSTWTHGQPGAGFGHILLPVGEHLLASAPWEHVGGVSDRGRVYVIGADDVDARVADLTRMDGAVASDELGHAMVVVGDTDGDGIDEVAIARRGAGSGRGGAALFPLTAFDEGGLSLEAATRVIIGGHNERCGASLAGGHDIDGDGLDDVIIGCPSASGGGVAHVVLGDGGRTGQDPAGMAWISVSGSHSGQRVGASLASPGDFDGDGLGDVFIGAPGDDGVDPGAGRVAGLMSPESGAWSMEEVDMADLWMVGHFEDQELGSHLAAPGDLNGDGLGDVIVGAPGREGALYFLLGEAR